MGAFTVVHCAETQERAIENGATRAAVDYLTYAFKVFAGGLEPRPKSRESAADRRRDQGALPYRDLVKEYPLLPKLLKGRVAYEDLDREDMVIVGDVDHCIRKLERYRDAGLDRVLCLMQAGDVPHDAVMRSLELFGEHVIPRFSPT